MTLIFLSLGWLTGLWLGLMSAAGVDRADILAQIGPWLAGLAALGTMAALLGRGDRRLGVTALVVVIGILGVWRAFGAGPADNSLVGQAGEVTLRGTISGRPEPSDAALLLTIDVDEIASGSGREPAQARVLVRTDRYSEWGYGDRVTASGRLQPVDSSSGYWAEYLARQGIYSTLEYPRILLEARPQGPDFQRAVDGLRGRLEAVSAVLFPEPQASLLAGILVGGRASMPADFRDALNVTSTSHIVAVSGFNVTVVAGVVLLAALRFLTRRKATLLAIAAVWAYSLLTGFPPSAMRAALMASLALSAILAGRSGDTLSFLCLSAAIMAGIDPLLLYDLGYQLSFLATAGLVLLEPVLRGRLGRLPGWLAASLSVTLAAQLATLPVLVSNFHTLSLVAPLSNLLIAPALPLLMGLGALAVALGAVLEPLGHAVAPAAWLPLTYLVETIRWTAQFPGASVMTGGVGIGAMALYYLLLLALALWPLPEMGRARAAAAAMTSRAPRWALAGTPVAVLCLGALAFVGGPDGKVHVYFLDVGHGDATLIRSPDGYQVLVDGGPSPTAITGALGRRLGFLDRRLDAVVVTGYEEDRLAGLLEVARRHEIGLVLQPATAPTGPAGRAWSELLVDRGLNPVKAEAGQQIDLGPEARLEVLWAPERDSEEGGDLVVRLIAGGVSVLLPGDVSRAAQVEVARATPGRAEVLRVPAHGAAGALDELFLQRVSPRLAVASIQAGNRFGHPAESTMQLLSRHALVLRTDRSGCVELSIGREGYEVLTDR